jgi:hypothetical protein
MIKIALCCALFLCLSNLAFAGYGPYPDHPNLNEANNVIYSALDFLARAQNPEDPGNPFGGFREQAEDILQNRALPDIYQSVLYANAHPDEDSCPSYPYSGNPDPYPRHPELSRAEVLLERAVVSLRNACNGDNQFGGHREDAIEAVQRAEANIADAVRWANTH